MSMIPEEPGADFSDLLRPEHERSYELWQGGKYPLEQMLHFPRSDRLLIDPPHTPKYGNIMIEKAYETLIMALADGVVVTIDGLPIYPVVSQDPEIQRRYRDLRRRGWHHVSAMANAML